MIFKAPNHLLSKKEYQRFLQRAEMHLQNDWSPLSGGQLEIGDQLRTRIVNEAQGLKTIYERLAAMHAVMRASGAYFSGSEQDPYRIFSAERLADRESNAPTEVFLHYSMHSNSFDHFRLFFPEWALVVALPIVVPSSEAAIRGDVLRPIRPNEFYVTAVFPPSLINVLLGLDSNSWWFGGRSAGCPPLPKEPLNN